MMGQQTNSIADNILGHVETTPQRTALTLLNDHGNDVLSYTDLDVAARNMAQHMTALGIEAGDVVVISLPLSRALIAALVGAFYLGAVPALLPYDISSPERPQLLDQLKNLVAHVKAAGVVTDKDRSTALEHVFADQNSPPLVISSSASLDSTNEVPTFADRSGAQAAYLQFTSGTTGMRKAAQLSHDAIIICVSEFAERLGISNKTDVIINWLPLYHDFGLFAGLMTPLLTGTPAVLMSPERCLRRPHLLLQAVHDNKGTLSWTTNSGLQFIAKHASAKRTDGLDLSSLRVLCAGGEPTRFDVLKTFGDRFASVGLRPEALVSGYGMAETTMGVTVPDPTAEPRIDWIAKTVLLDGKVARPSSPHSDGALPMVNNGTPLPSTEVRIVGDIGQTLNDRMVGNIWLRGKTVMTRYHGDPQATQNAFCNGWFKTNDTGYLADGHLYVIGRADDRIMSGAKTIHPEDLEALAETLDILPSGKTVAFGVYDPHLGTEKVVLVCGMSSAQNLTETDAHAQKIRDLCKQHLDVSIQTIIFVHKSWIVKAANGKMARQANKTKYLAEYAQD